MECLNLIMFQDGKEEARKGRHQPGGEEGTKIGTLMTSVIATPAGFIRVSPHSFLFPPTRCRIWSRSSSLVNNGRCRACGDSASVVFFLPVPLFATGGALRGAIVAGEGVSLSPEVLASALARGRRARERGRRQGSGRDVLMRFPPFYNPRRQSGNPAPVNGVASHFPHSPRSHDRRGVGIEGSFPSYSPVIFTAVNMNRCRDMGAFSTFWHHAPHAWLPGTSGPISLRASRQLRARHGPGSYCQPSENQGTMGRRRPGQGSGARQALPR